MRGGKLTKIYWAAPLHDKKDRDRNTMYVSELRKHGFEVYVPQEHGVWEDYLVRFNHDVEKTRRYFYVNDLKAMKEADVCIACAGNLDDPRGPSEGMLWEMGYMEAALKTIILFNEDDYWDYNLMPVFGSDYVCRKWDDVIDILCREEFA